MSHEIIIAPLVTLIIVQSIKLATDGIKGNFNLKSIFSTYGGMPSTHSAFVTSISTMVAYKEGIESSAFGIALIFAIIVITDALVFRKYIDQNNHAINKLIARLPSDEQKQFPLISTALRHTLPQALVGILIGFTISTVINFI
ncbi:divergent PAP2 family protein [Patescibacteria group bacterium]|nr:divergent PAP2 family protein [Patescibacteria group bacterium]MBU0963954.1 divergent PAP2 family protein [Patescibacteria group bacterium]